MKKYKKIFDIGLGLIALFLVAGATMAFSQAPAMAEENDMETNFIFQPLFDFAGQAIRELAAELGLDLATIRQNLQMAREEVIQQAVADGIITQEQAELLADNPRPVRSGRPGLRAMANRVFNERGFYRAREIWDAALADALGISVDELQTARQEALEATLDQAVEEGVLSEERA
ncbi:MAG: hypothetical protein PVH03_08140, partial [Chloroflexota bacterium]